MFSYAFYEKGPLCMIFLYVFLNALAIALYSLAVLAIHMIIPLKNRYLALLIPFILLYLFSHFLGVAQAYSPNMVLNVIIQPMAACALRTIMKPEDVWLVFGIYSSAILILLGIGYLKNGDSL